MRSRFFQAVTSVARFRFSLASLFVIVTVISVVLGIKVHAVRSQRNAVAAIQAVGGSVAYDFQYEGNLIVGPSFMAFSMTNAETAPSVPFGLDKLLGTDYFASVVRVTLNDRGVDDDLLAKLTCLSNLKDLGLSRTAISDAGMQYVNQFRQLEILQLQGTSLTDRGLEQLADLHELKLLSIGGTYITDEGLEQVGNFPKLRVLKLDNTISLQNMVHKRTRTSLFTNVGLQHLLPCKTLEQLYVGGTQIQPSDTAALEKAVPNLRIVY